MNQKPAYSKFIDTIKKEEFISFFSSQKPETWFSERELHEYKFPGNAQSLAGRFLIKRTIGDYIKNCRDIHEIEILNNEFGKPEILLGRNIRHAIELTGIKKICCSISHSRNFITSLTIFCF